MRTTLPTVKGRSDPQPSAAATRRAPTDRATAAGHAGIAAVATGRERRSVPRPLHGAPCTGPPARGPTRLRRPLDAAGRSHAQNCLTSQFVRNQPVTGSMPTAWKLIWKPVSRPAGTV